MTNQVYERIPNYFPARSYEPNWGRFTAPDWSAEPEAVPYANLGNPQSLNLYGYQGDNPVSNVDADGHCWPWCTALAGAAIGAATGAVIETVSELAQGEHLDSNQIEHAAIGGAITGGIIGVGGPEAAAAVGLGEGTVATALGITGSVAGGAAERGLDGKSALEPASVAMDAAVGAGSALLEGATTKLITATAVREPANRAAESGAAILISIPAPPKPKPTAPCKDRSPCDQLPGAKLATGAGGGDR